MPRYRLLNIKKHIAAKLLATVFLFYLVVTLVLTAAQMISQYYEVKNNIQKELKVFQKTFEGNLAHALWELNDMALESIINGMVELQDIIGVKITDHKGDDIFGISGIIINQKGEYVSVNKQGDQISADKSFDQLFWHEFTVEYSHESGTTKVGNATIYSSSSLVFKKVKFGFIFLVVNAIIKTLALWFIFLWVSHFLLNRPLSIITSTIEKLDLDNIETHKIDLKSSDENEFKIIENSFNRMVNKLAINKKELQKLTFSLKKHGDNLENLVDERTFELSKKNRQLKLEIQERKQAEEEREKLIKELQEAFENIKTLSGLLPICSKCKKIRDDKGYWKNLEEYIQTHSDVSFSHGMCTECSDELYGKEDWYIEMKKEKSQEE